MSSRRGTAVFLKDILDEASDRMAEQRHESVNTRALEDSRVADNLGISAVLINDLKQKRNRSYEFSWEKALVGKGDSGIKLQYTHCRLHSLLEAQSEQRINLWNILDNAVGGGEAFCGQLWLLSYLISSFALFLSAADPWKLFQSSLDEPCALALVHHIARFDETLRDCLLELEPCLLVQYLFKLSNLASKALKELPVKQERDKDKADARLILFEATKTVLAEGMRILGLNPLDEM